MRRLPPSVAEDLLEVFVRRYEHGSILLTTNRPLEDWGQVLADNRRKHLCLSGGAPRVATVFLTTKEVCVDSTLT